MWLTLLCFHLIGLVGFNLNLRQSLLAKVDRLTLATIAQTGIAMPAVVLLAIRPPPFGAFTGLDYFYLASAMALTIGLQVTNVKALQYLEASVFSVLYNLRIILTTALGVLFLNEAIVGLRIAGGLLILFAIFIVKQQSSQEVRIKGIAWGLTAATALSFLNLSEKLLINSIGFLNYFPLTAVVCAVLMWSYIGLSKRSVEPAMLKQPKMLQLMTLRAMSAYGFSGALAAGALISVANYISGMSVIFMVVLGAILLGERDYLGRKIAATAVAIAGLTVVLFSSL